MKRAFISGIAGQDGSYLAELLVAKGYDVSGLVRMSGDNRLQRLDSVRQRVTLIWGDLHNTDTIEMIAKGGYDEIYHLAAVSQVQQSFWNPTACFDTNLIATTRLLERLMHHKAHARFYFAATSEMFGSMDYGATADEAHPHQGQSPYAISKIAAYHAVRMYRQQGMFAVNGIAFNHESRRRGENFVTRKLGKGLRRFKKDATPVKLGNPSAVRDWHHAKDTVRGMWLSLQHAVPEDFVFASGTPRTVKGLATECCRVFDVNPQHAVHYNDRYEIRPWDVEYLCGKPRKAKSVLGWVPEISFEEMVEDVCAE